MADRSCRLLASHVPAALHGRFLQLSASLCERQSFFPPVLFMKEAGKS